ncbi:murein hydrolase activator EnvC family protein [Microbacterium sp. ZW T5_45]|uniref:murein hydrolase activator EnvC family protein n=1 Tax=Microbacterium sp. ZW T5_45 TaxID=3378080 RepID=UPI00385357E2
MRTPRRLLAIALTGLFAGGAHAVVHATPAPAWWDAAAPNAVVEPERGAEAVPRADADEWSWPVPGARHVVIPFRAPAHAYGAGHRGIDILAPESGVVRAPADGVVAFSGTVVDRPLLTIEHPGGYVSTFEPMVSTLSPGDAVAQGAEIGSVVVGGHSAPGTLHIGVRLDGDYINPMLLFGGVPRAVLLPCCE